MLLPEWVLFVTAFVTGLFVGSFLNVVIHRGPVLWKLVDGDPRGTLLGPRSYCPACAAPIRYRDLVPVVSYLVLGGKCPACSAQISLRYPMVELAGGLAALGAAMLFGLSAPGLAAFVFFLLLIALAAIDLETNFLPDALTFTLIALGLAANAFGLFMPGPIPSVLGAVIGYGAFAGLGAAFKQFRGVEGLGLGDAKLLAGLGAWLGWAALPLIVFFGAMIALIGVAAAKLAGEKVARETEIPFGPALAAAGVLAMLAHGLGVPLLLL